MCNLWAALRNHGTIRQDQGGLQKTHSTLTHEIKRIISLSPRLNSDSIDDLEAALIAADLGMPTTQRIIEAVKKAYETQGSEAADVFEIASREVTASLGPLPLISSDLPQVPPWSPSWGERHRKTTTAAKLARMVQDQGQPQCLQPATPFAPLRLSSSRFGAGV
jgi:fused signal recognition particle receptor